MQLRALSDNAKSLEQQLLVRKMNIEPYLSEVPLSSKLYWLGEKLFYSYTFYINPVALLGLLYHKGYNGHTFKRIVTLSTKMQCMYIYFMRHEHTTALENYVLLATAAITLALNIIPFIGPEANYRSVIIALFIMEQLLLWAIVNNLVRQIPSISIVYEKVMTRLNNESEKVAIAINLGCANYLHNNGPTAGYWERASATASTLASSAIGLFRSSSVVDRAVDCFWGNTFSDSKEDRIISPAFSTQFKM